MDKGDEFIIEADFHDGYSLRNMLVLIRQTTPRANLIFTKDGITIKETDASDSILTHCEIYGDELLNYQYNVYDDNGDLVEALALGFQTTDMQKATKIVGKKNGIKLYVKKVENPSICVQRILSPSSSTSDGNLGGLRIVNILPVDIQEFEEIKYTRDRPNVKPTSTEFAKICQDFASYKCTHTDIISFDNGLILQGFESSTMKSVEPLGRVPDIKHYQSSHQIGYSGDKSKPKLNVITKDEICRIRVHSKIIRAMAKFNNLSPSGIIKLYLEKDNPFKIVSAIGTYGKLTLYIRDMPKE
jgi:hypothetical protein